MRIRTSKSIAHKRPDFDPRQLAGIDAMLRKMNARDELSYRFALRGLFPRIRGRREWDRRIDTLQGSLCRNEDALVRMMNRSRRVSERIVGELLRGL